ncbi:MAG TPA: ATPase, T2SS/T4P/T4SS family [Acidobacteriota bacterium]|nr:ATPase, T2SS/T4P/T4SS family [Acidobacteriota bacterium]
MNYPAVSALTPPDLLPDSTFLTSEDIQQLLSQLIETGVSDLHLRGWHPPYQRNPNGELLLIEEAPVRVIPEPELFRLGYWLCRGTNYIQHLQALEQQFSRLHYQVQRTESGQFESLEAHSDSFQTWITPEPFDIGVDVVSSEGRTGRFRVQIFFAESDSPFEAGLNMAFRRILPAVPTHLDLGFCPAASHLISDLVSQKLTNGLVLVVGATGSGKSTSVAAMLETLNEKVALNITTIEDPVEFKFHNKRSFFRQIGIRRHVPTYAQALNHVLRQDPDIIVIQEIRDAEMARHALNLAQTNHLVIATLHGLTDTASALLQFVQMVGGDYLSVANHLQAIVAQQLLPSKNRDAKRVLVQEVMRPRLNAAIQHLLRSHSADTDAYAGAIGRANEARSIEVRFVESLFTAVSHNEISAGRAFTATRYEADLLELFEARSPGNAISDYIPQYLQQRDRAEMA